MLKIIISNCMNVPDNNYEMMIFTGAWYRK